MLQIVGKSQKNHRLLTPATIYYYDLSDSLSSNTKNSFGYLPTCTSKNANVTSTPSYLVFPKELTKSSLPLYEQKIQLFNRKGQWHYRKFLIPINIWLTGLAMSVTMKDPKGVLLAIVVALTSVATAEENSHSNSARDDRKISMDTFV